jgi:FkbM family methyltransferase
VPFGPLRGAKLFYDRSVNYNAVLGLWEPETFRILGEMLTFLKETQPRIVACDLGANIGLITLWLSLQLRERGAIFSFEPSPSVLPLLRQNLAANNLENVTLVEAACSDTNGTIDFFLGPNHHVSSLHQARAGGDSTSPERVTVNAITLDNYFSEAGREPPNLFKIDIEGGGTYALPGCRKCVEKKRPLILIESHTPDEDKAISDLILTYDYHAYRLQNKEWVEERGEIHPNPKGVWGTLFLCGSEHRDYFSKKFTPNRTSHK